MVDIDVNWLTSSGAKSPSVPNEDEADSDEEEESRRKADTIIEEVHHIKWRGRKGYFMQWIKGAMCHSKDEQYVIDIERPLTSYRVCNIIIYTLHNQFKCCRHSIVIVFRHTLTVSGHV